jgi:hypothetical protein
MTTATDTSKTLINLPKPTFHVLGSCPVTGKLAERQESDLFSIPQGQAVWWKCSACNGWHASIMEDGLPQ